MELRAAPPPVREGHAHLRNSVQLRRARGCNREKAAALNDVGEYFKGISTAAPAVEAVETYQDDGDRPRYSGNWKVRTLACSRKLGGGSSGQPVNLCVKNDTGEIILSDTRENCLKIISPSGQAVDGKNKLVKTHMLHPRGVLSIGAGAILVCDSGHHRIRKVLADGTVEGFAGCGKRGFRDGAASEALFNYPSDLCIAADGSILVSDRGNHRIRRIFNSGRKIMVETVAGSEEGHVDHYSSQARFNSPTGMVMCPRDGSIYIADTKNHCIRRMSFDFERVVTHAGKAGDAGCVDGLVLRARFRAPTGLALAPDESLIVCDTENNCIRRVMTGVIPLYTNTVAGETQWGLTDGSNASAHFSRPTGITMSRDGQSFLIADTGNNSIRLLRNLSAFDNQNDIRHQPPRGPSSAEALVLNHPFFRKNNNITETKHIAPNPFVPEGRGARPGSPLSRQISDVLKTTQNFVSKRSKVEMNVEMTVKTKDDTEKQSRVPYTPGESIFSAPIYHVMPATSQVLQESKPSHRLAHGESRIQNSTTGLGADLMDPNRMSDLMGIMSARMNEEENGEKDTTRIVSTCNEEQRHTDPHDNEGIAPSDQTVAGSSNIRMVIQEGNLGQVLKTTDDVGRYLDSVGIAGEKSIFPAQGEVAGNEERVSPSPAVPTVPKSAVKKANNSTATKARAPSTTNTSKSPSPRDTSRHVAWGDMPSYTTPAPGIRTKRNANTPGVNTPATLSGTPELISRSMLDDEVPSPSVADIETPWKQSRLDFNDGNSLPPTPDAPYGRSPSRPITQYSPSLHSRTPGGSAAVSADLYFTMEDAMCRVMSKALNEGGKHTPDYWIRSMQSVFGLLMANSSDMINVAHSDHGALSEVVRERLHNLAEQLLAMDPTTCRFLTAPREYYDLLIQTMSPGSTLFEFGVNDAYGMPVFMCGDRYYITRDSEFSITVRITDKEHAYYSERSIRSITLVLASGQRIRGEDICYTDVQQAVSVKFYLQSQNLQNFHDFSIRDGNTDADSTLKAFIQTCEAGYLDGHVEIDVFSGVHSYSAFCLTFGLAVTDSHLNNAFTSMKNHTLTRVSVLPMKLRALAMHFSLSLLKLEKPTDASQKSDRSDSLSDTGLATEETVEAKTHISTPHAAILQAVDTMIGQESPTGSSQGIQEDSSPADITLMEATNSRRASDLIEF